MPVHVSIHDVSPVWEREVDLAIEMAHAAGARPALLVVPDYHGRACLLDHPAFVDKLRALEAGGHEIYLHGYYHRARTWDDPERDEASAKGRGIGARLRHAFAQKVVSASEAEFSDVSREEAIQRMDDGERMLKEAGLGIAGFVAPAWSMPAWVLALLGERGYRFTEDHLRVHDPARGRSRASVVMNYASRTPARLVSSVAWCRLARPARRWIPARIAIHPADMGFALLRSEVASLLAWASGDFVDTGRRLLD
jgi:predicted deacetylase